MPLVDQFVPVKRPESSQLPYISHAPRSLSAAPRQRVSHHPAAERTVRQAQSAKAAAKVSSSPKRKQRVNWRHIGKQIPAAVILLVLIGVTGSLVIGEAAIAVYGITVLILRIPSRSTFFLALLLLLGVPLLLALAPTTGLAENCAVFAFLFLVVGTISLAFENRGLPSYSRRT